MKLPPALVVLALGVLGCDGSRGDILTTTPVTDSSAALALSARLASVEREVAESEARAARAREEAKFFECKTSVERVRAEVLAETTSCLRQIADQAACDAREEREKGDKTLIGCIGGIGVAYLTGGAGLPYALSGCAAGRVAADVSADPCPMPVCAATLETVHKSHLQREGWSEYPQCGGRLGVEVETPSLTLVGGLRVVVAGRLASGGVRENDFIAFANEKRVRTPDDLAKIVDDHSAQALAIKYVRDEKLYVGQIEWPRSVSSLDAEVTSAEKAEHRWGARVTAMDAGGTLAGENVLGLTILSLDGRDVASRDHLRDMLRYRRAGEKVSIVLGTVGKSGKKVDAVLAPRVNHEGI